MRNGPAVCSQGIKVKMPSSRSHWDNINLTVDPPVFSLSALHVNQEAFDQQLN